MFLFSRIYDLTEENTIDELISLYNIDVEDLEEEDIKIEVLTAFIEKLANKIDKSKNYKFDFKDWFQSEVSDLMEIEYDEEEDSFVFNCCLDDIFDEEPEDYEELIGTIVNYYENI
jgi:hypothetical protein